MTSKPQALKKLSSQDHYGTVFQEKEGADPVELGRLHFQNAIEILEYRLEKNRDLRRLPLTPAMSEKLRHECMEFLKKEAAGTFENDNLKHVGRLISHMKRYSADLKNALGIEAEDAILLAALHDLGKAQSAPAIEEFLTTIYGDFINLRVLPHELYSMYWIQQISRKAGIPENIAHTLMDQIANHNFGPNLSDPSNKHFLQSAPGAPHWWVEHWKAWAAKANAAGMSVNPIYGSPSLR